MEKRLVLNVWVFFFNIFNEIFFFKIIGKKGYLLYMLIRIWRSMCSEKVENLDFCVVWSFL